MAILTKDDLLAKFKTKLADDTSDEGITLLEDLSDTITDLETKSSDQTDWKTKYEENDASWRKKYTERFFSPAPKDETPPAPSSSPADDDDQLGLKYEDLFKEKENG